MNGDLTRNWWVLVVREVLPIIFGLLAWSWPEIALAALVLEGIAAIAAGVRRHGPTPAPPNSDPACIIPRDR